VVAEPVALDDMDVVLAGALETQEIRNAFLEEVGLIALLAFAFSALGGALARLALRPSAVRLSETEKRFKQLVEDSGDPIVISTVDGRVIDCNQAFEDLFRSPKKSILARESHAFWVDPSAREVFVERLMSLERLVGEEIHLRRTDGSEVVCLATVSLRRDEAGNAERIESILKDITELKRREAELEASEANYFDLFQHAPEMLLSVEAGTATIRECNATLLRETGYAREDLLGQPVLKFCPPGVLETVQSYQEEFRASGCADEVEAALLRKDGSRMPVSCKVAGVYASDGDLVAVRVALRNISGQKELADRLDRILQGTQDGLWDWPDIERDEFWWSPSFFELLGFSPDAFRPKNAVFMDLLHPADREAQAQDMQRALGTGGPFESVFRLRHKSGEYLWVQSRGQAYLGGDGEPTRVSGSVRDISARKKLEDDLSTTTSSLIEAQAIAEVGSWRWDFETGPGPASEEQYRIFGLDSSEGPPPLDDLLRQFHPDDREPWLAALEKARTTGSMELRVRIHRANDGEERVLQARGRGIRGPDGTAIGVAGVTMDVTDRLRHERVLEAERDRARQYLDTAEVMMVVLDRRGRVEMINRKGCETLGRPEAECLGKDWFELAIPEEIRGELRGMFDKVMAGVIESPSQYENVILNSAGGRIPIAWYNSPLRDETGSIASVLSSGTDLTELHKAQHALRESQNRLESVINTMQAGVVLQAASGQILFANEPAGRIFGMAVSDVEGKTSHDPVWQMVDEEGIPVQGEDHPAMATLRTGEPVRGAIRGLFSGDPDRTRWLLINTEPLLNPTTGEVSEVVSTFLDITERRTSEEALRESEERYRSLFTWMGEGFAIQEMVWDDAGEPFDYRFLDMNPAFERLTGFSRESIVGRTFREVLPGFEPTWLQRYGEVVRASGSILFSGFALPLGRHFEVQAFHLDGNRFAVTFNDITDRVASEKALQESESRFRGVFLDSPTGITLAGPNGKMAAVNPRFCEMLGYTEEELLGRDPDEFTHPYDLRLSSRQTRELDTLVGSGWEVEKRYLRKDGAAVWCTLRTSEILDEHGNLKYSLGMIQDISPRRKAEAELGESEARLRALASRLASVREQERAAVSRELHDELGQALTVLRMDLSLLHGELRKEEDPGDLSDRLGKLVSMADTNIDLVRSISSRLRPPILDVLGLGAAIEWQVDEYRSRADVEFHLDISLESKEVSKANATSLFRITQEALTNVLRHADASNVWVTLGRQEHWIQLTVRDDGRGIKPGDSVSPTALGLLGMEERAMSMGGDLSVTEDPGGGTIVRARIPAGFGKGGETQ
jgi:PAS domain S-box-containing protein